MVSNLKYELNHIITKRANADPGDLQSYRPKSSHVLSYTTLEDEIKLEKGRYPSCLNGYTIWQLEVILLTITVTLHIL